MGKRHNAKHNKPKKPFLQRWLPWKGDSKGQVILKIITLIMLVVFLGSAGYLVNELVILPAQTDMVMDEIQEIYYDLSSSEESSKEEGTQSETESTQSKEEEPELTDEQVRAQIKKLQEINPDIIGWIRIPNTVIDYPVL